METEKSRIEVAAVYIDGMVRIYGPVPKKGNKDRPFIRAMQFQTYGQALQFAIDFEEAQINSK